MKFIPILFSTPMVQAILNCSKTQTRRVVKSKHESGLFAVGKNKFGQITEVTSLDWDEKSVDTTNDIGYKYQVGDILWVRETFRESPKNATWKRYSYKADYNCYLAELGKWKPNIHMPKAACRIFLKITNVRVERLQDISEDDAIKEGVEVIGGKIDDSPVFRNYLQLGIKNGYGFPRNSFSSLWKSINGEQSWKDNPWVWVIEFESIEKPENFC